MFSYSISSYHSAANEQHNYMLQPPEFSLAIRSSSLHRTAFYWSAIRSECQFKHSLQFLGASSAKLSTSYHLLHLQNFTLLGVLLHSDIALLHYCHLFLNPLHRLFNFSTSSLDNLSLGSFCRYCNNFHSFRYKWNTGNSIKHFTQITNIKFLTYRLFANLFDVP